MLSFIRILSFNEMKAYLFDNVLVKKLDGLERKKFLSAVRIIKYLYFNGPQPIASICKYSKISSPNAFAVLTDLMTRKLVEKKGRGASKGGRKPELYSLCNNAFYVLGVDMDIYQTRISLFNAANENVSGLKTVEIELNNNISTLDVLIQHLKSFIAEQGINQGEILGIGLSFPGLVDSVKGVNHTYFNFGKKAVRDVLQEQMGLPVFVENDAKAIALAVWRLGLAKSKKDVLVLFLDWGIGLGMILDGKLYRGSSGFAGEFSHIPIVENGDLCICGKLGCLQTLAAGTTLVKMVKDGILAGRGSLLSTMEPAELQKVGLNQIIDAALDGDQHSINALSAIGENLGKGIAILIQLFNPELIVLGGKMAEAGQFLTTPIRQAVNKYCISQISDQAIIEVSKMGKEIGVIGALAVVMEDVFEFIGKGSAR